MEMRTFVLTFPLFSEYDLISKRKREGDAVTRDDDGEEEDVTLAGNRARHRRQGRAMA